MAKINLPKFIAEHYKGGVTAKDVVREALTNAIQAGGTEIEVRLNFSPRQQSLLDDERNFLQEIEIIDNGEGFTSRNVEYFDEVCTSHKDSIGGKGVGRLSFLKYGDQVLITSQLKNELVTFQQARREDKIVDALSRGQGVSWDDVSHLASEDLARYIVHRTLLIDSLSRLPEGEREDAIHQAILPKGNDGSDLRTNNVWIVDDKFLSYSSVYSDQTLSRIISDVGEIAASRLGRKPDIAAFFTTDADSKPNKLVIIEFKKPGSDIFDSNKALAQCRLYASDLAEAISSVREIFTFAVVDVDDEFFRDLRQQGFKPVFSLSERVLYNDYAVGPANEVPLHLYVSPAAALLKDAKARNRIFEEVLQFNPAKT